MLEVDARGLSCPEPIMLCAEAMDEHAGESFYVLVSEPHQKTNIEKFVHGRGRECEAEEDGSGFKILVK